MKPEGIGKYESLVPGTFYFCRMCRTSLEGRTLSTLYCLKCERRRAKIVSIPIQIAYHKRIREIKKKLKNGE